MNSIQKELLKGVELIDAKHRLAHHMIEHDGKYMPTEASIETLDGNVLGACGRKVFLEKMSIGNKLEKYFPICKETPSLRRGFIFSFGKQFENVIADLLTESGHTVINNGKFRFPIPGSKLYISAEFDHIVIDKDTGEAYGLEDKTGNGHSFTMRRVQGYKRSPSTQEKEEYVTDPTKPSPAPEHLLQAMLYLYAFQNGLVKDLYPYNVTNWRFLYLSRDTMEFREFALQLDKVGNLHYPVLMHINNDEQWDMISTIPITVEDIFSRYKTIESFVSTETIPPADFHASLDFSEVQDYNRRGLLSESRKKAMQSGAMEAADWKCRYCKWHPVCKDLPREGFKLTEQISVPVS